MELNNNSNNVLLLLAAIQQQQQQINLLEALFTINQDPSADAIETIAQRIGSTNQDVASWFHHRREQHRARQATAAAEAAAAAAAAASTHLGNLVLNNLLLDPQQLQQHLQQQQQHQQQQQQQHHQPQTPAALSLGCLTNSNGPTSATLGGSSGSNGGSAANNISQYYYDYPISNASSSPTIQQPIQMGGLNATPNSADSPPSHLQTNNTHHQDTSPSSSSILAKLTAVTSGLSSAQTAGAAAGGGPLPPPSHNHQNHVLACSGSNKLDSRLIDLLEALYAINDNPEMGAIEMISKRVDVPCHLISEWFDKKRMKLNPFAGPRSPPVNKKREGGRVVTFSEYQRSLLEAIFNENNYLHPQEYEELSRLIQVPSRNIKIWFKNRRSKQRLSSGNRVVSNVRCDSDPIESNQHLNHHHLQ